MLKWTVFAASLISTQLLQSEEMPLEAISEPPKLIKLNEELLSQSLEVKPAQIDNEADIQPLEVKTVNESGEVMNQPISKSRTDSKSCSMEFLLELRAAYFYPTDHKVRAVYSGGGLYSAEFSFQAWKYLYPWASVGYLQMSGHSRGGHVSTDLQLVPTALGLKFLYALNQFNFYVGLGVLGTYAHTHDHSHYVTKNISEWGIGGIAKSGLMVYLNHHLFLDFFCDYSYMRIEYNKHKRHLIPQTADLSSVTAGAGLGWKF